MIRVAVIDDNPKSRKNLVKTLGREPDIRVVAEAAASAAGIREVAEQKPDVILLDNAKPFTDGLAGTEMIVSRFQDAKIIVLAVNSKNALLPLHTKQTLTASACLVGACFHLCQACSTREILAAVRQGASLEERPPASAPQA
jgi:NarL family two-component system response regulator LiaR